MTNANFDEAKMRTLETDNARLNEHASVCNYLLKANKQCRDEFLDINVSSRAALFQFEDRITTLNKKIEVLTNNLNEVVKENSDLKKEKEALLKGKESEVIEGEKAKLAAV